MIAGLADQNQEFGGKLNTLKEMLRVPVVGFSEHFA
jgi:hypothetical protein